MKRFLVSVPVVLLALLFGLATVSLATADSNKKGGDGDKKEDAAKSKAPQNLDDATATVTQTVDGKEKKTKITLKYCLKVKGFFDDKGFHIEEVEQGGPATQLSGGAAMEKGDIIVEVEGKPVRSPEEYAKAINGAADHTKLKLKVRDVNTGNDQDFETAADKR
jgi:C-terminal processing protease CtpA/Prc